MHTHIHSEFPSAVQVTEDRYAGYTGERALRVYVPVVDTSVAGVAILFHGGGFVHDELDAIAPLAETLSARLGITIVTPSYSLAREQPFPAAVEDAYAALERVHAAAGKCARWDNRHIVVAGIEAGGNLAAATAMLTRDRGGPALAAQVLISPMLDPSLSTRSMQCAGSQRCDAGYRAYLPKAADRLHPYAAPASSSRLAGLPPALIITAGTNPLRDEAECYGAKLIAAGVTTQVSRLDRIETEPYRWTEQTHDAVGTWLGPRLQS